MTANPSGIQRKLKTRKSSCVNARGIPTAAYQILPRWGTGGTPGQVRWGGYPRWGTPCGVHPPVGVPLHWSTPRPGLTGGYPHQGTPGQGTPQPGPRGTPIRVPPQPGPMGVPKVGYPPGRGTPHWTWLGYPPTRVWTDRRTDKSQNITFPSYYVRGR